MEKVDLIKRTMGVHRTETAYERHKNQQYDEFPYSLHLKGVMSVAFRYAPKYFSDDSIPLADIYQACLYHDHLEDCNMTYNDLVRISNVQVADIVYAVTNELGKNRKEKAERTYPKIRGNKYATFVKLCDRIANVRFSLYVYEPDGMYEKYRKEHNEFAEYLFIADQFQEMWVELTDLFQNQ